MPAGLKLRELQTIAEVAREKNLIVISNSMEIGGMAAMSKAFSEKNKG